MRTCSLHLFGAICLHFYFLSNEKLNHTTILSCLFNLNPPKLVARDLYLRQVNLAKKHLFSPSYNQNNPFLMFDFLEN